MDILNNREWALAIWFFIFIFFTLSSPKMKKVRKSFKQVLKAFFVKTIITTLALMIIYITIVVFGLFKIGLWESHQLKNTIIWAVYVGALSLFKINSIKKDPHFFKNSVLDNLKLVAIVQLVQRDAHDFMYSGTSMILCVSYFWFFAKIADIYFVWFYELLETRDLFILPADFLTSVDKGY